MSRPTPLEIQDALFAHPLRVVLYATAALAALAFFAPWEAGPDGVAWTWDLWSGREAFFLLPLVGGVLLSAAAAVEAVPGIALGAGSLVLGAVWLLAAGEGFEPLWLLLGGGDDDRATLAALVLPLWLGGLGWRIALHRTLVGRIVLGLGVAAVASLYFVPLGADGRSVFQAALLDRFSEGSAVAVLSAAPPLLVLLAALASAAAIAPSARGTGGLSTLARAAFQLAAAAAACAMLLPFLASLPDQPHLSFGTFALPLKLAALWWCALIWLGLGFGSLAAAAEGFVRREPLATRRPAVTGTGAGAPAARPIAQGEPLLLSPAALAAAPGAPTAARPLDLSPLPAPPGFGGRADGVPVELHSKEPSEVVELQAHHALPILDTSPTPRAAPSVAPPAPAPALPRAAPSVPPPAPAPALPRAAPSVQPPATAGEGPRPASRGGVRTMLGMPGSLPGPRPGTSGAVVAGPDQSGRTGDTSLGLPVARPLPPGARPSAQQPSEESGLRFWPPKADEQAVRHDAATPAFGVQVIRELAMQESPPDRQTPVASSGGVRGAGVQASTPAAGPAATPPGPASGPAAEALRFRVSDLQRRLARGELTPDQYQQRLDELRKSSR